jgi:Ser/Thr protein kinase RdoA (MazF antagonist)
LAVDLGHTLAALHSAISGEEALEIGFPKRNSLVLLDAVDTELSPHKEAEKIRAALPSIKRWFAALPLDLVFCHRDIQAYNFTIDKNTGALLGLFDIEDAGIEHRAEDLKYLPSYGMTFTSLALQAYNQAAKTNVTMEEVGYFHTLSALEHFLFISRERTRWPQIVDWSLAAIEKFCR